MDSTMSPNYHNNERTKKRATRNSEVINRYFANRKTSYLRENLTEAKELESIIEKADEVKITRVEDNSTASFVSLLYVIYCSFDFHYIKKNLSEKGFNDSIAFRNSGFMTTDEKTGEKYYNVSYTKNNYNIGIRFYNRK